MSVLSRSSLRAAVFSGLAARVVSTAPRRSTVRTNLSDNQVILPRSELTAAPGTYGLWYGPNFAHYARVGNVVDRSGKFVRRELLSPVRHGGPARAFWTGHKFGGPEGLGRPHSHVDVPIPAGDHCAAWLFPARHASSRWAIHLQGIRTSRIVTLPGVEAAAQAGLTSLVLAYSGAGDGPPQPASSLGLDEWRDVAAAIAFAKKEGATEIHLVGWSMGAGVALETARRMPEDVASLVLISPATNWQRIIEHGVTAAGLPRLAARQVARTLSSVAGARRIGLSRPLDFNLLDWSRPDAVKVPTLLIHSGGDRIIPVSHSRDLAGAHSSLVTLIETAAAPHGWEANVDPDKFNESITRWLIDQCA